MVLPNWHFSRQTLQEIKRKRNVVSWKITPNLDGRADSEKTLPIKKDHILKLVFHVVKDTRVFAIWTDVSCSFSDFLYTAYNRFTFKKNFKTACILYRQPDALARARTFELHEFGGIRKHKAVIFCFFYKKKANQTLRDVILVITKGYATNHSAR